MTFVPPEEAGSSSPLIRALGKYHATPGKANRKAAKEALQGFVGQESSPAHSQVLSDLLLRLCVANNTVGALLLLEEQKTFGYDLDVNCIGPIAAHGSSSSSSGSGSGSGSSANTSPDPEEPGVTPAPTGGAKSRGAPKTHGCTSPLIAAAHHGASDVVLHLLQHKADPQLSVDGWLPQEAARLAQTPRKLLDAVGAPLLDGQAAGADGSSSSSSSSEEQRPMNKPKCEELIAAQMRRARHADLDSAARNALPPGTSMGYANAPPPTRAQKRRASARTPAHAAPLSLSSRLSPLSFPSLTI